VSIYAQLEDVEERMGQPIPPAEAHEYEHLLDEAEVELAAIAGDLAARVIAGLTTPDRLKQAVVGMVLRARRDAAAREALMLSNRSSAAERAQVKGWLTVTRTERRLAGLFAAGQSVSLSDADEALVEPVRRPPLAEGWRRNYAVGWEPSS
jgi:hypothetical protein